MRHPSLRREKRNSTGASGQTVLVFPEEPRGQAPGPQQAFSFDGIITIINERMDRQEQKLDRLNSTQLTVCQQLKDLRANLPMQRRPLSLFAQQIHVEVINAKRNGLCPCCQEVPVCNEFGRLAGAEFDHFFSRHRARPQETWLVCSACNQRLNQPEFKTSSRSLFEGYQLALRRVTQTRQGSFVENREPAVS